jgi:hypothetical protein
MAEVIGHHHDARHQQLDHLALLLPVRSVALDARDAKGYQSPALAVQGGLASGDASEEVRDQLGLSHLQRFDDPH